MSALRTAAILIIVLPALGMGSTAPAQPETRPIYPFLGNLDAAYYKWAENPESATVWVFREPVPAEDSGGRPISDPGENSQWPDSSGLVGKTSLMLAPHPEHSTDALRTAVEFPIRREGRKLRYLVAIETSRGIYYSRTLGNSRVNLPRYYTLGSPAHVRIGKADPKWEKQARALIRPVQQTREKRDVPSDTSTSAEGISAKTDDSPRTESSRAVKAPLRLRLLRKKRSRRNQQRQSPVLRGVAHPGTISSSNGGL